MTGDLHRMAGDPLGVSWPVEVPCPDCGGEGGGHINQHWFDCGTCADTYGTEGTIPNPAITQTCGACGGSGEVVGAADDASGRRYKLQCDNCDGLGYTIIQTVRVAERVRVVDSLSNAMPHLYLQPLSLLVWFRFIDSMGVQRTQDITHLWPEEPCPEPYLDGDEDANAPIRTFPKPGELWEVGYREAEVVPVVALKVTSFGDVRALERDKGERRILVGRDGVVWWVDHDTAEDVTHHFPDGPPSVGDRAGVLGSLTLFDRARLVSQAAERSDQARRVES